MNSSPLSFRTFVATLLALWAFPGFGQQSVSTVDASALADAAPAEAEIVHLDPFVVSADEDGGSYEATATTAATRIRTELKDVGSAITVVTSQFLKDTNSRNSQDLLVYTPNTEVGGLGGNFAGLTETGATLSDLNARLAPQNNTRVRGLAAADNTRDFFLTDIAWDGFNIGRIDIQRGPNAILFGLGSPAGIINASTNGASFANQGSLDFSVGRFGSHRATLDFNQVLRRDELAVRLDALDDRTKFQQEPAFNHDRRIFGALRWDPKFLRRGSARTSLRINFEHGEIEANRPHVVPPGDRITPWFTELNRQGVNGATWQGDPTLVGLVEGLNVSTQAAVFENPASADGTLRQTSYPPNFPLLAQVRDPASYRPPSTSPADQFKVYRSSVLLDTSVFDYRNRLPEGPNKREWSDHDITNVALAQTFLDDRLGLEAAYDRQETNRAAIGGADRLPLTVDINTHLIDGSPNPNFGRVFLRTTGTDGAAFASTREATRVTAFGELRFKDVIGDSSLARALGRHLFTGLWSREQADIERYSWVGQNADDAFIPYNYFNHPNIALRQITTLNYLGPSLADRTTPAGANLPNISALQPVRSGTLRYYEDANPWDMTPGAWTNRAVGVVNNDNAARERTRGAFLRRDDVDSQALVWQGYLFDDLVVPMIGLRHDRARGYALTTTPLNADETTDYSSPRYALPSTPNSVVEGDSTSWSVVVHSPQFIRDRLPGDTAVSLFYNRSENFQPKAGRIDPLGTALPPPIGETEDYGFRVSAFEGRVNLKVNWYDTVVANDALPEFSNFYIMPAVEAWGYQFARRNLEEIREFAPNPTATPPYAGGYLPVSGQTAAEARADGVAISTAFLNPANQPPDSFFTLYGIDRTRYATGMGQTNPGFLGVTVTGDTRSTGTEYELTAQPTPNWNLTVNMSHTNAESHNLAGSVAAWIEQRWAVFNTPVAGTSRPARIGDVRFWGPWPDPSQTVREYFRNVIWIPYTIYRAKESTGVSELRPWRFNFITDYTFRQGRLAGLKLGGAYRWQDEVVVGYPVFPDADESTIEAYDLAHPYTGPAESNIDLWIGYERKFAEKYTWRIQLNVNNAFADDELIPVNVQPDGRAATARIPEATIWTVTNSISF